MVSVWTSPDPATLYRRPADGTEIRNERDGWYVVKTAAGKPRVRGPFSGRDKAMEACDA